MAAVERFTENYLTCVICSEVYSDPATLQCDHTFCRPCLLKYVKTQPKAMETKSIRCPSCRQMTRLNVPSTDITVEDWINQVKPTRLIQGLVENFGPGTGSKGMKICHWCKNGGDTALATFWCPMCEEYFCDKCCEIHSRVSLTLNHQTTPLSDDFVQKKKRPFMCSKHNDEKVKLFCKDCNKAICHTCCSIHHRQCKTVVEIESIIPHVTKTLKTKKDLMKSKVEDKQIKITEMKDDVEVIETRTIRTESEIKGVTQQIIDQIREKERGLLSDLTAMKSRQLEELRADIKLEEITVQTFQQQIEFTDQAIKSDSQKDMFSMFELCDIPDNNREDRQVNRIRFTHDMDRLREVVDNILLGEVEVVKDVSDRKSSAFLHRTFDFHMEGDIRDTSLHDVMVLSIPDGKTIVAADYNNNKIKAFYDLYTTTYTKSLNLSFGPWQFAHIKDNIIAVSLPKGSQIVIMKFDSDPVVISNIKTDTRYYGLYCFSATSLMGGNYQMETSVSIMNVEGKTQTSMTTGVVKNPDYIHVTRNWNIIVSEESVQAVVSVTSDGKVIFTYKPTGDRALKRPRGITSTSNGDILLTDRKLNKVVQLTDSGQFVRDIITDGLDSPRGLCVDDDGMLYVTSSNYVKVYRFV